MIKKRTINKRNPIARVVTQLGRRIVPDKRKEERLKALDEIVKEAQRLGFYDHPNEDV